jgi:hypothetical protein
MRTRRRTVRNERRRRKRRKERTGRTKTFRVSLLVIFNLNLLKNMLRLS